MQFWSTDDKVIKIGRDIFIFAAVFQVFDAATIIYNGALRGAGDTLWLAGISAFSAILIMGLGGYLMVKYFINLGVMGPWLAATAGIMFVGIANRLRFKSNRWMRIDLFERRPVGIPMEIEGTVE
jgi:MATE family multidrug resistance protein